MPLALVFRGVIGGVAAGIAWTHPYLEVAVTSGHGGEGGASVLDAWLTLSSQLILGGMALGALLFGTIDRAVNRRLMAFLLQLAACALWLVKWQFSPTGTAGVLIGLGLGVLSYVPWLVLNCAEGSMASERRWLPFFSGVFAGVAMLLMAASRTAFLFADERYGLSGAYLCAAAAAGISAPLILVLKPERRTATLRDCAASMWFTLRKPICVALMSVSALNSGTIAGRDLYVSDRLRIESDNNTTVVALLSVAFLIAAVAAIVAGQYAGDVVRRVKTAVYAGFSFTLVSLALDIAFAIWWPGFWLDELITTGGIEIGSAIVTALVATLNLGFQKPRYWSQIVAWVVFAKFVAAFVFAQATRVVFAPHFGWQGVVWLSFGSAVLGMLAVRWVVRIQLRGRHVSSGPIRRWFESGYRNPQAPFALQGWHGRVSLHWTEDDVNNPPPLSCIGLRPEAAAADGPTPRWLRRPGVDTHDAADPLVLAWILMRQSPFSPLALRILLDRSAPPPHGTEPDPRLAIRWALRGSIADHQPWAARYAAWWIDVAGRLAAEFLAISDFDSSVKAARKLGREQSAVRARLWDALQALQLIRPDGVEMVDSEVSDAVDLHRRARDDVHSSSDRSASSSTRCRRWRRISIRRPRTRSQDSVRCVRSPSNCSSVRTRPSRTTSRRCSLGPGSRAMQASCSA